jgi:hypothetical protein
VTRQGVGERAAEAWRAVGKIRETADGVARAEGPSGFQGVEVPQVEEEPKLWTPRDIPATQLSLF